MVNRVLQPQEIEVFYVLPAVRREFAMCMKAEGKSQKEIAKLLGVTGAAVSQYMSAKRASLLKFTDDMRKEIKESAARIECEMTLTREMQRIVNLVRDARIVCQVHEGLGNVPAGCNVCFENKEGRGHGKET